MSYVLEDSSEMTALANAIRTKSGQSGSMTVSQLTTAVNGISGGSALTYTIGASSNSAGSGTSTQITLPSALQGGGKDFYIGIVGCTSTAGTTIAAFAVFEYKSSNNTFTRKYSFAKDGYMNTAAWTNSSTKEKVTITASKTMYWRKSSSDIQDYFIIY